MLGGGIGRPPSLTSIRMPLVAEGPEWIDERAVQDRDRAGSPRSTADEDQALLRLSQQVRPAAELRHLPGLPGPARLTARHERAGLPARAASGARAQLHHRQSPRAEERFHEMGPQELLLPRSAEELSDQPVRPALQPRRLARDQRREGRRRRSSSARKSASSGPIWKRTRGRTCTTNPAKAATPGWTSTAPAHPFWRSSPSPT